MKYYRAKSLTTLLNEVNARAPKRDKASDGWIGDASHAAAKSDHNPDYNRGGVVRAMDIDHDPANGCDAGVLANQIAKMLGKHPALGSGAYVIYNRRIVSTDRLKEGWRLYFGVNAHKAHVHVSVGQRGYDSTEKWGVLTPAKKVKAAVSRWPISLKVAQRAADGKVRGKRASVRRIQKGLNRWSGPTPLKADGYWGPKTKARYKAFQRAHGLRATGRPAPKSLSILAAQYGRYRVTK